MHPVHTFDYNTEQCYATSAAILARDWWLTCIIMLLMCLHTRHHLIENSISMLYMYTHMDLYTCWTHACTYVHMHTHTTHAAHTNTVTHYAYSQERGSAGFNSWQLLYVAPPFHHVLFSFTGLWRVHGVWDWCYQTSSYIRLLSDIKSHKMQLNWWCYAVQATNVITNVHKQILGHTMQLSQCTWWWCCNGC